MARPDIKQKLTALGMVDPVLEPVTGVWKEQISGYQETLGATKIPSCTGAMGGQLGIVAGSTLPFTVMVTNPETGEPATFTIDPSKVSAQEWNEAIRARQPYAAYASLDARCREPGPGPAPDTPTVFMKGAGMAKKTAGKSLVEQAAAVPRLTVPRVKIPGVPQAPVPAPTPVQEANQPLDVTYHTAAGDIVVAYSNGKIENKMLILLMEGTETGRQRFHPAEAPDNPIAVGVMAGTQAIELTVYSAGIAFKDFSGGELLVLPIESINGQALQ